jgi:beta-lactamase regulating signal transducer with metallopeptidase domain
MMGMGLSALGGLHAISQAAAGGLLTAVWQSALLAAAAGLGLRLVPKTPAAVRFAIWFAVFAVVAMLPVVALWPHSAGVAQASGHDAWFMLDGRWSVAIAAVWLIATLLRAATLVVAGFRVHALWRRATPVEAFSSTHQGEALMDGAPGLIGLNGRKAQVCVSDEVDRPSVIGFFSPKILIPRWLLERLTPAELEQIVLHEAGHLGRADDWLNLAQKIALVLFPLNPALVWVERRLCFERELACDERVLRATGAPKIYAACLTSLAEHRMGRPTMALSLGALGRESELGRRVGRILRFGEWMRPAQARAVMGFAMLGLLGGATELARCPQVVGFSPAHSGGSQVAASVAPARAANGLGYQTVVFRPDQARTTLRQVLDYRDSTAMNEAPRMPVERKQSALHDVAAKDERPVDSNGVSNRDMNTRVGQWLVLTSWRGMDGTHMVLTTMSLPDVSETPARVLEGDAPSDATGEPDAGQAQSAPQQVRRYAAVPVRGGWLVIQL